MYLVSQSSLARLLLARYEYGQRCFTSFPATEDAAFMPIPIDSYQERQPPCWHAPFAGRSQPQQLFNTIWSHLLMGIRRRPDQMLGGLPELLNLLQSRRERYLGCEKGARAYDYRKSSPPKDGMLAEEGQEGAGLVMVWNEGTYTPQREMGKGVLEEVTERVEAEALMQQGLAAGQLKFRLHGHKLQSSFALVRTRGFGKKESWLLVKHRDSYTQAGYDANAYDFSAGSLRSLAEIASQQPTTP